MADSDIFGSDTEKKVGEQELSHDELKDAGFMGQADLPQAADKVPEHDQTPDALKADADKEVGKDASMDAPKADEITGADAEKAASEGKTDAVSAAPSAATLSGSETANLPSASASADSSASTTGGKASEADVAQDSKGASADSASLPAPSVEAKPAAASDEPKQDDVPKFEDAHPEAQAIIDAAPEAMDLLKEAGNKLAPAIKKFQSLEDKLFKLEDEAKARFQHLRQKATEAVAALEAIFKRG